jgi:membrane protein
MPDINLHIRNRLWPEAAPSHHAAPLYLIALRHVYALLRDLSDGALSLRAMSLVYTTMLAVVPLLAFSFSVAKGLGLHRQLEPVLLQFLAPIGPRAAEINASVIGFIDNVSGLGLASVSIGLLLLTALSMAQKVESSFNFVWRVDRPRSLARRFSEYLSVIFVGPLVMVVATGLMTSLRSTRVVEWLSRFGPLESWLPLLSDAMPYLLVILAFSFLYLVIPNTRVRWRPALIGGLFAGIAWMTTGRVFAGVIINSTRYEAIYSGFAIVIILMFWLYLSWLILLLGSQFAFYLQNPYHLRLGQRTEPISSATRERIALSSMLLIARDFDQPRQGWTIESLAAELRLPRTVLESVLDALSHAGLITETAAQRLIPARALARIGLADIVGAVRHGELKRDQREEWDAVVESVAGEISSAVNAALAGRSLADMVAADPPGADSHPKRSY